jgi:hypothetical protein
MVLSRLIVRRFDARYLRLLAQCVRPATRNAVDEGDIGTFAPRHAWWLNSKNEFAQLNAPSVRAPTALPLLKSFEIRVASTLAAQRREPVQGAGLRVPWRRSANAHGIAAGPRVIGS